MLEDIRILDFSHVYFGPFTTMILGDMGAEVLKIEPPWGEMGRFYPPLFGGVSSAFHYLNRNKKGLALNLKDPKAKDIVTALVETSDVVVENFRRGTMDKLGLSYEEIREIKPDIIYASLSGFGLDGPYKDRTSFAPIASSYSGWYRLTGDLIDHEGPPIRPAEWHGDLDPALWGVIAILGAIRHRDKTGEGQLVDVSQMDCMVAMNGVSLTTYMLSGELPWKVRTKYLRPSTFGMFKAKDGWVYVAADPYMHERLKAAMGLEDLGEDAEILREWVGSLSVEEVVDRLSHAAVPVAPILQLDEVVEDPQVKARGIIQEVNHSQAGEVRLPGFPLKFSKSYGSVRLPAPVLGEHNNQILGEVLGYSEEYIQKLRRNGVIV